MKTMNNSTNASLSTPIKSIVLQLCSNTSFILGRSQIDEFLLSILMKEFTIETWNELHKLSSLFKVYELSSNHFSCPIVNKLCSFTYQANTDLTSSIGPALEFIPLNHERFQLTPQSKVTILSQEYHAILLLDFSQSIRTIGQNVLIESLFNKLYEIWFTFSFLSSSMNITIWISILLDLGHCKHSPVYICCHVNPQLSDFTTIIEILSSYLLPLENTFSPSSITHLLSCALQCSQYQKTNASFVMFLTTGILDSTLPIHYCHLLRRFTSINIPIHVCLLDIKTACFGSVPDIEMFEYLSRSTGGHYGLDLKITSTLMMDRSYIKLIPKHFSFDISPPTNTQLAFPWDPFISLPIICIPTRYRDYEVAFPMDVIQARLRQGFILQTCLFKSKFTIQLILLFYPEVCVHYKLKLSTDRSFAKVEINILAFLEFTMNLFKHPSSHSSSSSSSFTSTSTSSMEITKFQDFLRSLVDQDLVYKVLMNVSQTLFQSTLQDNKEAFMQWVETLLRTHLDWLDQDIIYIGGSQTYFFQLLESWITFIIQDQFYVHLDDTSSFPFSFTVLQCLEKSDQYLVFQVYYYKTKNLPSFLSSLISTSNSHPISLTPFFKYDGTVSVIHGPHIHLNQLLLKHTSHSFHVGSDLALNMATIALEHFSNLGYKVLKSNSTSVTMVFNDCQSIVSFHEHSICIDTYHIPNLVGIELKSLINKLSAMYTLDCLLRKQFGQEHEEHDPIWNNSNELHGFPMNPELTLCEKDPFFSISNLLMHSNLTILGIHNQIQLPIHAFAKTLRRHIADQCFDSPFSFSLNEDFFHHTIHEWHGLTPPTCSQFETSIYISTESVLVLLLPFYTHVPYVLIFECIMNSMGVQSWNHISMAPHCLTPLQQMYPLVSTFYYTPYHILTENMDIFLCDCAWQATVECVYSLSHQLHPLHVEACLEHLTNWTITLDISLLICLFEVLTIHSKKDTTILNWIDEACHRFNKCLHTFMRIIPDSSFFTLLEPFIFASMFLVQDQPSPCRKTIISCPLGPLSKKEMKRKSKTMEYMGKNEDVYEMDLSCYTESQLLMMTTQYMYPYPIYLAFSFYALPRDIPQVSSLTPSIVSSLENEIKQIILTLFLAIQPITERILEIILNDLNILTFTDFQLNVVPSTTVTFIRTELERLEFQGLQKISVGPYFLLYHPFTSYQAMLESFFPSQKNTTLDSFDQAKELEEGFGIFLHEDEIEEEEETEQKNEKEEEKKRDDGSTVDTLNQYQQRLHSNPTTPMSNTHSSIVYSNSNKRKEWIILSVDRCHLRVYSNVEQIQVLLQSIVPELCKMVNMRVLLNQLRDTHSSSLFLIPLKESSNLNDNEPSHSLDKETKENEEESLLHASPGEFACPIQFSFSFPLHWRLKSMVSLNSISSSLHSFAVINRKHTFVLVSPEESIYYMHLKEVIHQPNPSITLSGSTTPVIPSVNHPTLSYPSTNLLEEDVSLSTSPHISVSSSSTTPATATATATTSTAITSSNIPMASALPTTTTSVSTPFTTSRNLVLELHGLDPLTKDFANEVVNMVASKLSNVILQQLSTYFSRTSSSLSRLTPADVQFLLPIVRGPKVTFLLSERAIQRVNEDEMAILYFRQSLLTFTSALCSTDVITTMTQHLQLKYNLSISSKETYDISPFDMGFLYCSVASRNLTSLEMAIGQGITCIFFYLFQEGQVCLHPNPKEPFYWWVEFWTHGSIHIQALLEHIQHCQSQSLHDLEMEQELQSLFIDKVDSIPFCFSTSSIFRTLSQAPSDYYSCLYLHRTSIRIAPWKRVELLNHIQSQFSELSFQRDTFSSMYCFLPSSKVQAWCYYNSYVHQWKLEKWVKVPMDRHFIFFVQVNEDDIFILCWNGKSTFLEAVQTHLDSYIALYSEHLKALQQLTLYKMGLSSLPLPSSIHATTTTTTTITTTPTKITTSPSLLSPSPHVLNVTQPLDTNQTFLSNNPLSIPERMLLEASLSISKRKESPTSSEHTNGLSFISEWNGHFQNASDILSLKRYSQLIYSCRVPLFFNCSFSSTNFGYFSSPILPELTYLKPFMTSILDKLILEFSEHLSSLGFTLVYTNKEELSFFRLNQEVSLPRPSYYFQQVCSSGCIVVKVTLDHFFLKIQMYQWLRPLSSLPNFLSSPSVNLPTITSLGSSTFPPIQNYYRNLIELGFNLRQQLRVSAFVYDFHVFTIIPSIQQPTMVIFPWMQVLQALPKTSLGSSTTTCLNTLPKDTKTLVFYGTVSYAHQPSITYLFSKALKFSLGTIRDSSIQACYFYLKGKPKPTLLIMHQIDLGIQYYLLETDLSSFSFLSKPMIRKESEAMQAILDLLKKANECYERECLWQSLIAGPPKEISEIVKLTRQFFNTSLLSLDPNLHFLLSLPADWKEVAKMLPLEWPFTFKTLNYDMNTMDSISDTVNLNVPSDSTSMMNSTVREESHSFGLCYMLFNEDATTFFLVSFTPPHVTLVIREKEEEKGEESKEGIPSLVSLLVMTFSKVLWRQLNSSVLACNF